MFTCPVFLQQAANQRGHFSLGGSPVSPIAPSPPESGLGGSGSRKQGFGSGEAADAPLP